MPPLQGNDQLAVPKTPSPKEIREAYSEYKNEWADIQDEATVDMRYISGDPWDPADRAQREDAGRPCISLDELNQYINQYNNNLRQNKRAIQLIPKGDGADDKDATRREGIVRGIENTSNAQDAYITAAESAASRSYGFALLRTEYQEDQSFDQNIVIKRVANPDTILLNPGYEKADGSDVEDGFVLKRMPKAAFKKKYPNAEKVSFTSDDQRTAKGWIGDKEVQVAEYWKLHRVPRTLLLVDDEKVGETIIWEDELPEALKRDAKGKFKSAKSGIKVKREREVMTPEVIQYLTNGLEILDEIPWAGSRIPIISCFGKELWFDDGGGARRHLFSMVRLARNPMMLYAYLATQECEEAGMTPKSPFIGYKGQFESARDTWELITKQPFAFIEADILLDTPVGSPLPLPARPQWVPNFQAYEIAKDSARRAIQAAMGISPLPTAAQRDSEKSGIALEKIDTQESVGSFHFQDNFTNGFLHNMGWQVNELISEIYDTERELPIEKADGTHDTLHIVGYTSHPIDDDGSYDQPQLPEDVNGEHLHTGKGNFDVTISEGPSFESQREQQSEFVDHLIANWQELGIPPAIGVKILAIGIKMKDLGAMGDAIAELLNPPDPNNMPPAAQAAIAQLQGQVQQLSQENQALHMERAAKLLEQQTKIKIETLKGQHMLDAKTIDYITQIVKAELTKGSQAAAGQAAADADKELAMLGFQQDQVKQGADNQHDATMQHSEQAHEVAHGAVEHARAMELAKQQAVTAQTQQASQQAHEANQTTQGQVHERTMAQEAAENQPENE